MSFAGSVDPLQLWVLTAAADSGNSFSRLRSPGADHRLNMSFPYVPVSDLADAFLRLIRDGYIRVRGRDRRRPDLVRIAVWINEREWDRHEPWYQLTTAGGLVWERECRANWKKFLTNRSDFHTFDKDGDRNRFRTVFEGASKERLGFYALAFRGGGFRCEAMRWKELEPWKATYWKTLPKGFQLTCWFEKIDYLPGRERAVWPLWDLRHWYQDPPRVHEQGHRMPVRLCFPRDLHC